jgi:DUF1365 family protein
VRSALYTGVVRHRRFEPAPRQLRARVAMPLLDLDELAGGGDAARLLARLPPWLCRFERSDYLGDPRQPLAEAARDLVEERLGFRPCGVRLLTNLRTLGHNFNPLSVYFCDGSGGEPAAIVLEVTNTPWGERTCYVEATGPGGRMRRQRLAKQMHVSPFLPMDLDYLVSCTPPGERLAVRFDLRAGERRVFDADLWARRRPLGTAALAVLLAGYPLMPQRVIAGIYLHAARLFLSGVPVHPHPSTLARRRAGTSQRDAA